jgi:hypothetical protein
LWKFDFFIGYLLPRSSRNPKRSPKMTVSKWTDQGHSGFIFGLPGTMVLSSCVYLPCSRLKEECVVRKCMRIIMETRLHKIPRATGRICVLDNIAGYHRGVAYSATFLERPGVIQRLGSRHQISCNSLLARSSVSTFIYYDVIIVTSYSRQITSHSE